MAEAALIGAGGGLIGSGIDHGVAAHVRNQNWSRQKRVLQESIRWRVNDLRQAGLNPILAASSGLGGGASANMAGSSPSGSGAAIASGMNAGVQAGRAGSEIAAKEAQARMTGAQHDLLRAQEGKIADERALIRQQTAKTAADALSAGVNYNRAIYDLAPAKAFARALEMEFNQDQYGNRRVYGDNNNWMERTAIRGGSAAKTGYDWIREAIDEFTRQNVENRAQRSKKHPNRPRTTKLR